MPASRISTPTTCQSTQPLPAARRADRRLGREERADPHPQGRQDRASTRRRRCILSILNEAWSDNWGFIPLTDAEIAYAGKKLKPIVLEDMILVAEYDGEPVAFMMALPDINEFIVDLKGELFPFGWAKLLWRLKRMRPKGGRVPLMGVVKKLHATRLASQLAFMMIEYIRRAGNGHYGITPRRGRLDPRRQQRR